MIVNLEKKDRDLLVTEMEKTTILELRDELKQDEAALKNVLEKLKIGA
jgi:hypothetical protein